MLIYHRTSLMDSTAQTVVNTVNCVGVMGKGIAAEFKMRYPEMFGAYREICAQKLLEPGKLWLWKSAEQWVLNFPTKVHWKNPSRIEWIELGLRKFVAEYQRRGITEISFPRLGCGNGNLDWNQVRPLMEQHLSHLPITVYVHDYERDIGVPEHLESAARFTDLCVAPEAGSFDRFRCQLNALVSRVGERLVDLHTSQPFTVSATDDGLLIRSESHVALVDPEDLRSAWVVMSSGLLTQERLGWASGDDGTRLLTLMSLLPNARPVEIQKANSNHPELAVQMKRVRSASGAAESGEQFEMSWH